MLCVFGLKTGMAWHLPRRSWTSKPCTQHAINIYLGYIQAQTSTQISSNTWKLIITYIKKRWCCHSTSCYNEVHDQCGSTRQTKWKKLGRTVLDDCIYNILERKGAHDYLLDKFLTASITRICERKNPKWQNKYLKACSKSIKPGESNWIWKWHRIAIWNILLNPHRNKILIVIFNKKDFQNKILIAYKTWCVGVVTDHN